MAVSFPASPSTNDTYTVGNKTWIWNGYAWDLVVASVAPAYETANAAYTIANAAYNNANSANGVASTKLANTSGVSFAGDLYFSTGNVSIGRSNPGYQLDVVGTVNASAVLVNGVAVGGGGGSMDYAYVNTSTTAANNYLGGLANTGFATQSMTVTSLSDASGTIAWDASTSRMATVTLSGTGRTVSNPTNLRAGSYVLVIKQDAGGSKTITTWGNVFKWPAAVVPTLSTTASTTDVFSFWCDGTNLYGTFIPDCR